MKKISIIGSTGSIGTQCLEILDQYTDQFSVTALTCGSNIKRLAAQARRYKPELIVVYDESKKAELSRLTADVDVRIEVGMEGLLQAATQPDADIVLTSVVGNIGLEPTVAAIKAGKDIALANKETLVTAGELIMPLAKEKGVRILPVDSEHSAIFQSLQGNRTNQVRRLILTASGGPFRGKTKRELEQVTAAQALKHPNWDMGRKISIDSATLMNKGLEVIEAKWLFGMEPEQIDVVVHPESIIHSMVEYRDSSVMAQMGAPDMRLPILYALTYPERLEASLPRLDFMKFSTLHFETPDKETFPCLDLAYDAMKSGGTMPTVLNAANEVLVEAFLNGKIGFYDIPAGIEKAMNQHTLIANPTLEDILEVDRETRQWIRTHKK